MDKTRTARATDALHLMIVGRFNLHTTANDICIVPSTNKESGVKTTEVCVNGNYIEDQPNPHIKYFFILDPNGFKIQFAENE